MTEFLGSPADSINEHDLPRVYLLLPLLERRDGVSLANHAQKIPAPDLALLLNVKHLRSLF
ncbi:MAG TPA: hypothetical protein VFA76_08115 [Terriglobales bacterium]|nr:hypothetical protein [Terriglobales bacterium]